jgi:hypothetical protein
MCVLRTTEINWAFDPSWWWLAERTNNIAFFHHFIFHYHFRAASFKNFSTWEGHTIVQVVGGHLLITEVQVRPQDNQCWICDRNLILGLVFCLNTEVFFCQRHSTNATHVYFFLYHQHYLVAVSDSIAKYSTKKVWTVGSTGNQQMIQRGRPLDCCVHHKCVVMRHNPVVSCCWGTAVTTWRPS